MLCRITRWQLASALDRKGPLSGSCAAHVARCADCRQFAGRLDQLHARLASGAGLAPHPPALRGARRRVSRALVAGAALAVAGAAAALLYVRAPAEDDRAAGAQRSVAARAAATAPEPDAVRAEAPAPERVPAPRGPASPTRHVVERLAVLYTAPPPLRAEIAALASDGERGALAILQIGGVRDWAAR